jgi:hypothetical protein
LSAAVLTRKSTMLVVVAVAAVDGLRRWRAWRRPRAAGGDRAGLPAAAAAWALPVLAFLAWQLAVAAATGSAPLLDDTSNLSLPLVALVPAALEWLAGGP